MFQDCTSLKKIIFGLLDFKLVKNVNYMFANCKALLEIDIFHFKCSKVLYCNSMFEGCRSLQNINLGVLDFKLVKDFICSNVVKN